MEQSTALFEDDDCGADSKRREPLLDRAGEENGQ